MQRQRLTITLSDDILKKIDNQIDGRKLRNRSHAIESFLAKKLKSSIIKKAIILGGGQGIKLKGKIIPRPLLPIKGKTLIEHNIEILRNYGITNLILSAGGLGEQIRAKLKDGAKYKIKILYFERDQGTANVLRQAKSLLDDTFLMANGDILLEVIDLDDMYQFHKKNNGWGTVLLTTTGDPSGLGSIVMKGNQITRFQEKESTPEDISYLINAGVYLLEPSVCEIVSADTFSLEYDVFPELVKRGKLFGYYLNTKWIHLHDEEKYNNYLTSL